MKLISKNNGKHMRPDLPPTQPNDKQNPLNPVSEPTERSPRSDASRSTGATPLSASVPHADPLNRSVPLNSEGSFSETQASTSEKPEKKKKHLSFAYGYLIYILVFLAIIFVGLNILWRRMDAYERSRPYRPMDQLMSDHNASDWRRILSEAGVEDGYLDTLALDQASYVKKYGDYTDDKPVYSIRFGKKTMLTAFLKDGGSLSFGYHTWILDRFATVDSGLSVFAPEGATVFVNGSPVGPDCLIQRDAQDVTLGALESGRSDIPGLTKYLLNDCFTDERITVKDADGEQLTLGYQKGNSYYYPPLTSDYVILAPSLVTITVNGITLSEENAIITRTPLADFEGLGDSVPVHPEDLRYEIDGLVARPVVKAILPDGSNLPTDEEEGNRFVFRLHTDESFAEEQKPLIFKVFDAYIAFLGNRDAQLAQNYQTYLSYLVPGSEAAERASMSLGSLTWVTGRDAALESVSLNSLIRYSEDCFTALLDFNRKLPDGTDDQNSALFLFVQYQGQWRVLRVMNKTSFIRYG